VLLPPGNDSNNQAVQSKNASSKRKVGNALSQPGLPVVADRTYSVSMRKALEQRFGDVASTWIKIPGLIVSSSEAD
jgi:hypothetical protein